MSSSKAALDSVTNTLKRQATDDAVKKNAGGAKKLKTVFPQRSMSEASATEFIKTFHSTTRKQAEKAVRDQQKRVRELKKELKDAEAAVITAKADKEALDKKFLQATIMAKSDSERIIEQVKAGKSAPELGSNAIDDMLAVSKDKNDLIKLAKIIGQSGQGSLQEGACYALLRLQEPPEEAIKAFYSQVIEKEVTNSSPEVFPVIATAIGRLGSEKDAEALVSSVLAKAEQMSKEKEPYFSQYRTYCLNKCPIIDLLFPTWQRMRQESALAASAKVVEDACKSALLASVNEGEAFTNYAMPNEAAIAAKHKFPELERFLLSPTETSITLDLTNAGRKMVHDLIRQMEYGKLSDVSKGVGRDRVLVVRKKDAPAEEQIQARKERKEKHKELLQSMTA